tara:strand:+ start:188 stop:352 length:165 start_codon:yes stop_codon:yes gene_type:complete
MNESNTIIPIANANNDNTNNAIPAILSTTNQGVRNGKHQSSSLVFISTLGIRHP